MTQRGLESAACGPLPARRPRSEVGATRSRSGRAPRVGSRVLMAHPACLGWMTLRLLCLPPSPTLRADTELPHRTLVFSRGSPQLRRRCHGVRCSDANQDSCFQIPNPQWPRAICYLVSEELGRLRSVQGCKRKLSTKLCDTGEEIIGYLVPFITTEAFLPFYLVLQLSPPLITRVTQINSILR